MKKNQLLFLDPTYEDSDNFEPRKPAQMATKSNHNIHHQPTSVSRANQIKQTRDRSSSSSKENHHGHSRRARRTKKSKNPDPDEPEPDIWSPYGYHPQVRNFTEN